MAQLTSTRRRIFDEETKFRRAVSEAVAQKLGSSINFINNRQYDTKEFFINGTYGQINILPATAIDGLYIWPFDAEIVNIAVYNIVAGSSGTTELDVKIATTSGGPFTSIFSVTPKITSAAGNDVFALSYTVTENTTAQTWTLTTPPSGVTLAQIATLPYSVSTGQAMRIDIIDRQIDAQNCGLLIYHRPR